MQKKQFIIYGARGHGRALFYNLKNDGLDIICFIDRDKEIIKNHIKNVEIYKNISEVNKNYPKKENIQMILGVGGASSKDRKYLFEKVKKNKFSIEKYVSKSAEVANTSQLSQGVQVLLNSTIAGNVVLREGVIINSGSIVEHDSEIGSFSHVAPGVTICGSVSIGEMSFIGAGSTILPNIKIGSNTIVGAGSVVTKDIDSNCISFGSPSKVIKSIE